MILSIKGHSVFVDDEEWTKHRIHHLTSGAVFSGRLCDKKWFCSKSGYSRTLYAFCNVPFGSKTRAAYMHRILINAKPGQVIDHANGNALDNRIKNLRLADRAQNGWNRRPNTNQRFKGVRRRDDLFEAYITHRKKRIHLGCFQSEIQAAIAYNSAANRLFGEFANLNDLNAKSERSGARCVKIEATPAATPVSCDTSRQQIREFSRFEKLLIKTHCS
jgi:hypothetical protein